MRPKLNIAVLYSTSSDYVQSDRENLGSENRLHVSTCCAPRVAGQLRPLCRVFILVACSAILTLNDFLNVLPMFLVNAVASSISRHGLAGTGCRYSRERSGSLLTHRQDCGTKVCLQRGRLPWGFSANFKDQVFQARGTACVCFPILLPSLPGSFSYFLLEGEGRWDCLRLSVSPSLVLNDTSLDTPHPPPQGNEFPRFRWHESE